MEILLDSADLNEIKQAHEWGFVTGVTTSLSVDSIDTVKEIASLGFEHISVEPNCTDISEFVKQATELTAMIKYVVIKVPTNSLGFKIINAIKTESPTETFLRLKSLKTRFNDWSYFHDNFSVCINATGVFTPEQAMLVANSNVQFCSVFFGSIKERAFQTRDGFEIESVHQIAKNIQAACHKKVTIAADIRTIEHFYLARELDYDIVTVPFKMLMEILNKYSKLLYCHSWVAALN